MTVEKGIRKCGNSYLISIDLAPREGYKEKSYSYHIGTVKNLDKAKEIRRKAEEYRYFYGDDCLEELQELKREISSKKFTKKDAVKALNGLLDDHDRIYGEYTLFDRTDDSFDYNELEHKEEIEQWKAERKALVMAIKCLSK